ncbi:hypothetical protein REPUB_Repub04eG0110900 [Reevesia pubescens]
MHYSLWSYPHCCLIRNIFKTCNGFLQTLEKDIVEGFTLSDLWDSYTEWGAYGAGVPIVLNNGDRVVQYYSPSLSALQIYTRKPFSSSRSLLDQIDEKFWELGNTENPENGSCYDSGSEKIKKSLSNNSCLASNATWEDSTRFQFGSFTQETTDQCGYLYYQYNEIACPYDRVLFGEKNNELAKHYPGLPDLHCTDFSPHSWIAIAWSQKYMLEEKVEGISCPGEDRRSGSRKEEISLPPFAVVTYKMFGTLWINLDTSDKDSIICRQTAACYWLKLLQFQHHDFNFFMSRQFHY